MYMFSDKYPLSIYTGVVNLNDNSKLNLHEEKETFLLQDDLA